MLLPRSVPAMPPADRDYVQLRATRGVRTLTTVSWGHS